MMQPAGSAEGERGSSYGADGKRLRNPVPRLGANEQTVLDLVRTEGTISRTGLSRMSGISAATVGRIAAKLLAEEVLAEPRKLASPIGRPSVLLEVNASRAAVLAVELEGTQISAAVADLVGTIVWTASQDLDASDDPYDAVLRAVDRAKAESHAAGMPVAAVALGVPAIVDSESGQALAGPHVHWNGFALVERLGQDLGIPFVVDNDTNLAAIGHHWRGDATGSNNFCLFTIGAGIGGAIMSNGRLVRGHRNAAAEFGYLAVNPAAVLSNQPTSPGSSLGTGDAVGSLEEVVSESGITRQAQELLAAGMASTLSSSKLGSNEALTAQAVISAAIDGDSVATEVLDRVLSQLSIAIANVVCIAGPEVVIIDGPVGKLLAPFNQRLQDAVHRLAPWNSQITMSTMSSRPTLLGAVAVGLELAWSLDLPDKSDIVIGSASS